MRIGELAGRLRTWWAFAGETKRDHIRILAGILVIGGVGAFGYYVARPFWRSWQRDRSIKQAYEFAERKDYRSALLAMRRATELDMSDLNVWRQVANFLSDIDSPEALVARKNLVILSPSDLSLRLSYVVEALRFGEVESAREMMESVGEGQQQDLAYFRMAAAFAYATGMYDQMEEALSAIVLRDPNDWESSFNLASLQLWGPSADQAEKARARLMELMKIPGARVRASLELLKYVAVTGTRSDADTLVPLLVERFTGTAVARQPGDTLRSSPPGWQALLEALKANSASSGSDAAVLARWLASIGRGHEALVWLDSLGDRVRRDPLVLASELDLSVLADETDRVRDLLVRRDWVGMKPATFDLVVAARWQMRNHFDQHAKLTWEDACFSAEGSRPVLRMLVRLAGFWSMPDEKETTLRAIIEQYPSERWAYDALRASYMQRKDTEHLWQLYRLWLGREPSNRKIQESWVMLSILTDKMDSQAHALAKRMWEQNPTDPASAVCYAASLRLRGKLADATLVLDKLSLKEKEIPRVALWRSLVLAERGRKAEARQALAVVDPRRLLDEELRIYRLAASMSGAEVRSGRSGGL